MADNTENNQDKIVEMKKSLAEATDSLETAERKRLELSKVYEGVLNKIVKLDKDSLKSLEEYSEQTKKVLELNEKLLNIKKDLGTLTKDEEADFVKTKNTLDLVLKQITEWTDHYKKLLELSKGLTNSTVGFLQNLTGINKQTTTFASKFLQTANAGLGFAKSFESVGIGVKEFFGAENLQNASKLGKFFQSAGNFSLNIFTSMMNKAVSVSIEFAKNLEYAEKQVMKFTGAGQDALLVLKDVSYDMMEYGVTTQEAGSSMVSLSKNVNKFNQMSVSTRKEITGLVSVLGEIGIASEHISLAYNNLTTGYKASNNQANQVVRELADLGAMLGENDAGVRAFNDSLRTLGGYNLPVARKAFKELAMQAFSTGLEIKQLLDIASKFDTFEDAATSASKLNAILGGPLLNSTDLLLATESERIDILMKSIQQSGKSWQSLDKFEKKAIATSVGINDMTEANKLFGKSYGEYQKGLIEAQKVAESQKVAEERAKDAQTVMERLTVLTQQLVIGLAPLLSVIEAITNKIIEWNQATGGWLIPTLGALAGAIGIMKIAMMGFTPVLSALGATAPAAGKAAEKGLSSLGKGLESLGKSGKIGAIGLAILAGVVASMLLLAFAFKIVAESIVMLVPHLRTIFSVMSDYKGTLSLISLEILVFGTAVSLLGTMAPLILVGSLALSVLANALSYFVSKIRGDDQTEKVISNLSALAQSASNLKDIPGYLNDIGNAYTRMGENADSVSLNSLAGFGFISGLIKDNLSEYANAIMSVADAYKELSMNQNAIKPVIEMTQEVNRLSENKVSYLERISASTVNIIEASKDAKSAEVIDAIKEMVKAVQEQTKATVQSSNKEITVENNWKVGLDSLLGQTRLIPKQ